MEDLLVATATWLPITATPVLLVLLAPLAGRRARTGFAIALGVAALGAAVAALLTGGAERHLDVINPFLDPEQGGPVPFVVEAVTAPGWAFPAVGAVFLALPALVLFAVRRREPVVPCPVTFVVVLSVWALSARLALEKAAAPEAVTWGVGVTMTTLLAAPFVGWWAKAKGSSFRRWALMLLLIGLIQRSMIVGCSYFATIEGLGTHLDVSAIRELMLPLGHRDFTGPGDQSVSQWLHLMVVPQYAFWVPLTLFGGLTLGEGPYLGARRRSAPGS